MARVGCATRTAPMCCRTQSAKPATPTNWRRWARGSAAPNLEAEVEDFGAEAPPVRSERRRPCSFDLVRRLARALRPDAGFRGLRAELQITAADDALVELP